MISSGNENGQERKRARTGVVFLDKDGTLIRDVPYNVNPELVEWSTGAPEALRLLHRAGYEIIVVTNQSGVARGMFPEEALANLEAHLRKMMRAEGVPLLDFYYCPHHPEGTVPAYTKVCRCRKPAPGLVLDAIAEHDIDPDAAWFIGDILNDVEAGRRAGCRSILIDNGGETEWQLSRSRLPHHICSNLGEAARVIAAVEQLTPEATWNA